MKARTPEFQRKDKIGHCVCTRYQIDFGASEAVTEAGSQVCIHCISLALQSSFLLLLLNAEPLGKLQL